jgi:ABC-type Zn2+ transport system substrate-binding protein/surface adhesin
MIFALPRLTTLLALLLAAVLVMTQTLGVVHGITHGQSGSTLHSHDHDHAHDHTHDHAEVDVGAAGKHGFLAALFSLHQEDSDCRLYDQASHDGALVTAMQLTLPVVPPSLSVAIFQGEALARWAALFDARGPPLTV